MRTAWGVIFFCSTLVSLAQDYQGATPVLKLLAEKARLQAAKKTTDPVEALNLQIKAFLTEAAALPAAEAAARWVGLLDAFLTIPWTELRTNDTRSKGLDIQAVIESLPPVTAWEDIRTLLEKRKTTKPMQDEVLRLLAAALLGDKAGQEDILSRMRKEVASSPKKTENYQWYIDNIAKELWGTSARKVADFEEELTRLNKRAELKISGSLHGMAIPDLVSIKGEKYAEAALKRVLKLGPKSVEIEGNATQKLAAALVLKHTDTLKAPLWELVRSPDDAPLYEALQKKFPQQENSHSRSKAEQFYLLALISSGSTQEATRLIQEKNRRKENIRLAFYDLDATSSQRLEPVVLSFLQQLLSQDPSLPFWDEYIRLSARHNASGAALELLEKKLASPELSSEVRNQLQLLHCDALLAADQREEGLKELRALVTRATHDRIPDEKAQARAQEVRQRWEQAGVQVTDDMISRLQNGAFGPHPNDLYEHFRLCGRLAALGRLLDRQELTKEALSTAIATYEALPADSPDRESFADSLLTILLEYQPGPKAESLLTEQLSRLLAAGAEQRDMRTITRLLGQLAVLYDQAGRHADVLTLFEQCTYWNEWDLVALRFEHREAPPPELVAARALIGVGRTEEARRIILRALQGNPGQDSFYELLLKVGAGQPLEKLLDQLAKRDRFEERPLIWKARVLLDAGKLDAAEKAVRAAIAIDPSDGEQGKGDRMRAYAVLAEVLEKKGDAATAKIMRGVVSAIRKSEAADDWWQAGLLTEAVRRYEEALHDFADAYCIQSRLALSYSALGELAKAEQHYLRAFELMPESFGRMESHCFGCEGTFSGTQAQNAADKVFTLLASVPPVKAQVYYLLGILRESQSRQKDAAEAYRKAVETDPDYLNAWNKFYALNDAAGITPEERDNAALQMLRIDPARRHSSPDVRKVRDLRGLWSTLLEVENSLPPEETGPLMPLPAAKARMEAVQASGGERLPNYSNSYSRQVRFRGFISHHAVVDAITHLLDCLDSN